MKLVVGLGNPGSQYAATRHNIGFMVAERFAERHAVTLKKRGHQALYGVGRADGTEVTVLLPQTFMNLSGASVGSAVKSLGVMPGDLIVIHDDIDLPFGTLRVKRGGGHGGHNGIRHIREALGTGEFVRVKVGVGRPPVGGDVAAYVLGRFSAQDRDRLDSVLTNSVEAVEWILLRGLQETMNRFNNRETST